MRSQLAVSSDVALLEQAVEDFGLTYDIRELRSVDVPAYEGALDMQYADVG
jgi:hypothetical protein